MNRKIMEIINEELSQFQSDDYERLILSKFETPEYETWLNNFRGVKLGSSILNNDSTPKNISYSSFSISKNKYGNVNIQDLFYIHKSMIGDFYTFYVKSKVFIKYPEGKIMYPTTLIVSPESIYSSLFEEAQEKIIAIYPGARMVPFSILKMDLNYNIPFFKDAKINYYQALFGYEGDITKTEIIGDPWFKY